VGRRKKVRPEQIAEAVGSSVVTVSNALNDRKGGGEELRSRIKET
jgi:DNA-binding LacI/PurR family transcriptional regulator